MLGFHDHNNAARYVADMGVSEEWREMVLARREKLDIADKHHFIVAGVEDRGEHVLRMLVQPRELLGVGARDPAGSVPDAVSIRIFSDREQYLAYRPLDPPEIYWLAH